jgi:hypothetical protein
MGHSRTVRRAGGGGQQCAREYDPHPHGRVNEHRGADVTPVIFPCKAPRIVAYRSATGPLGNDLPGAQPGIKEAG